MAQILDDPWSDATFQRDPVIEAEQHAARHRHREVVQIPRLRAIGSVWLFAAVCGHNAVLLGGLNLRAVALFGALQCLYVAATTYSLRRHFRPEARVDLGTLYLATDIVVFVLAVYVSGGERSWLLPLLCVRVADQVGSSQRRALAFAHLTLILHLLLVAYLAWVELRPLMPGAEFAKVFFVYMLNLYLSLAAGPSERQRKRATQMATKTRELIEELGAKSEQLEREHGRAEAANRAKSRFLANMSHEIRTPMNGVLGTSELLLEGRLEAEQRQMVETIASCGRALLSIVNDILDMSKIEAGELRIDKSGFVVSAIIQEVVRSLGTQGRARAVELRTEVCKEASLPVIGDPLRLRQVLTNLVGNALKFTERGSVTLAVVREGAAESTLTLRFEVIDTGIGMTAEASQRVFDAFQQADDSTTRRFGGTGLGLSIAKQLVEMMGGEITVQSAIGQGSRFGFALCFVRGGAAEVPAEIGQERDTASELRALSPRVLVVEDTAVNRTLVQKMLQSLGCRVATAEDGIQAVALLGKPHDFALVLMDWHMPRLDGLQATRQVRAWERDHAPGRHTPIIAFTASAFAEETERCREAGMDGVLSKPVTKAQLLAALQQYLLGDSQNAASSAPPGDEPPTPLRNSLIQELLKLDAETPGGFLAEIIENFLDSVPGRLVEIEQAIGRGDSAEVEQLAHRLKGSAANLGAYRLSDPLGEIEHLANSGRLEGAADHLARALVAHEEAAAALRAMLQTLRARMASQP